MDHKSVDEIQANYQKRRDVLVESFTNGAGLMVKPQSTMFVGQKIPEVARHLGSMEFKTTLQEAKLQFLVMDLVKRVRDMRNRAYRK